MNVCYGNCNQGRTKCTCKGIQMDFAKPDRYLFLHSEYQSHKWGKLTTLILLGVICYFGWHIGNALY